MKLQSTLLYAFFCWSIIFFNLSVAYADQTSDGELINGRTEIAFIELEGDAFYSSLELTIETLEKRLKEIYQEYGHMLSITEMHEITDLITLMYREKGLIFHQAYILPQEIKGKTLIIHVQKGTLTDVVAYSNTLYSEAQLKKPFTHLIGKTLFKSEVQSALKTLKTYPGLKIFAYYSRGSKPGDIRLNLKVSEERASESSLALDNYGVKQTGENRLTFEHRRNNPFRQFGQLHLSLLSTNEKGNLFGGVSYSAPFSNTEAIGGAFLHSMFDVSGIFDELGITGELSSISGFWNYKQDVNKVGRIHKSAGLSLSARRSKVVSDAFPSFLNSKTDYVVASSSLTLSSVTEKTNDLHYQITFNPVFGSIFNKENISLSDHFLALKTKAQFRLQNWSTYINQNHQLGIVIDSQWSNSKLGSAEHFITTGAKVNRGFEPGIFSADSGLSFSVEQSINSSSYIDGYSFTPFVFFDYSAGWLTSSHKHSNFQSVGLGLNSTKTLSSSPLDQDKNQHSFLDKLSVGLSIGFPLSYRKTEVIADVEKDTTVYGRLELTF